MNLFNERLWLRFISNKMKCPFRGQPRCGSHNTAGSEFSAKHYEEFILARFQFSSPYASEFNILTAFAWPQRRFRPWVSALALISTSLSFSEFKNLLGSSTSQPASVLLLLLLAVLQHETLCGLRFLRQCSQ